MDEIREKTGEYKYVLRRDVPKRNKITTEVAQPSRSTETEPGALTPILATPSHELQTIYFTV